MSEDTPVPDLTPAFEIFVQRGAPADVGALAIGGRRIHVPVVGGTAAGELAGELVGGAETLFERADGVTVVEASYYVRGAEGATVRVIGQGYRTASETRMTLMIEAASDGSLAQLSAAVFLGEALPDDSRLAVMRIV